jgi:hypothetical protein
MSFAVRLVSDFASTPFAFKPQLGILSLPLLATCVTLMMMFRMKNMFSTARALRWSLSAGSANIIISQTGQEVSPFLHQESTNSLFYFVNR